MPELTKLTETACKKAPPNARLWDTEIKGFALFTGKTTKTFYFQKDVKGLTQRIKIGNYPLIDAFDARVAALELATEHATGVAAKKLTAKKTPTLEEALERYLARAKLRSEHNRGMVASQMKSHLKAWLKLPLDEITRSMCVEAHERISVVRSGKDVRGRPKQMGGQRAANHTLKTFRSVYNHALKTHELPVCPTIAIEWHPEEPPKTVIDDFDLWKKSVDALENDVHRAYYRFLLFTGLRRDEAMALRWDQVFDDHLHLPTTKNGRPFDLPLLDVHHAIIDPMRIYRSEFVFHGKRQALHLRRPAELPWSPHDHRRTFATVAEHDAGLSEGTVGHLLNHTPTSVTGRRYSATAYRHLIEPMKAVVGAFKQRDLL
jgi:integrase